MQENLKDSYSTNNQWLDVVETLSVLGSISGSIAAIVFHQIAFASIPLSLSVALNMVNRKLILDSINQSNQTAVAHLRRENGETKAQLQTLTEQPVAVAHLQQQNGETKAQLGTLNEQLVEVQQLITNVGQQQISYLQDYTQLLQSNQTTVAHLQHENGEIQVQLKTLTNQLAAVAHLQQHNSEIPIEIGTPTEQLVKVQQRVSDLSQRTSDLENHTYLLKREQIKITNTVGYLQEIETCNQAIRLNPNYAKAYYDRGLSYQYLGDRKGAIEDFTQAIRLNLCDAEAYHTRGLAYAELGDKQQAVEDLREAAKLFLEKGDMANYQKARDLSKEIHALSSSSRTTTPEKIEIESLFSQTH